MDFSIKTHQTRKNNMKILFLSTQPKQKQIESGLPLQSLWIEQAFSDVSESLEIQTIYAADEGVSDQSHIDGVIIGGSSHSVFEDAHWIRDLEVYVKQVIDAHVPLLGICFGHQLIAKALGGTVVQAPFGAEIGATRLRLTKQGMKDWLFEEIDEEFVSAMLHYDLVTELPSDRDSTELAYNALYRNQAIAYGDHVRTLQFHPEFSNALMAGLLQRYTDELIQKGVIKDYDHADYLIKLASGADFSLGKKIFQNFYRHALAHKVR